MTHAFAIRRAVATDLPELVNIYNHYVLNSHCTFDTVPFTVESRAPWWAQFDQARYQCWVAADETGILGYAWTSPFKVKPAYATSVEISVYVANGQSGRGIGRRLYETVLPELEAEDLHRAYAGIAIPNDASVQLHQRFGFEKTAHFTEVGRKFDKYWDVAWYQRAL
jgi:phosphinothricin acetyltransferase